MIFAPSLADLPRAGTLHVVAAPPRGSWAAVAIADETRRQGGSSREDGLVLIGPSQAARSARSLGIVVDAAIEPPLGIPGLLGRRLREVVVRRGVAPLTVQTWGPRLASAVHTATGLAERIVHSRPPADADELCANAAARFWRGHLESDRVCVRAELGIPEDAFVVLAGGDCAQSIDASGAFAVAGRAALSGAPVVLMAPSSARSAPQARRYAMASGLDRALVTIEQAEMPSRLWLAADARLLLRPIDASLAPWWGFTAWWALAAGLHVVAESCGPRIDGVVSFTPGVIEAASLRLVELARLRQECREPRAPTHR